MYRSGCVGGTWTTLTALNHSRGFAPDDRTRTGVGPTGSVAYRKTAPSVATHRAVLDLTRSDGQISNENFECVAPLNFDPWE